MDKSNQEMRREVGGLETKMDLFLYVSWHIQIDHMNGDGGHAPKVHAARCCLSVPLGAVNKITTAALHLEFASM